MSTPALTFYFAPGSSSMAPHIALHEIGVPFESKPVSFAKKEQREPPYLAINPEGKVPALVVDGRPLTEVLAILFYLARRFPDACLLPQDDFAHAQVLSWMSFVASTIHPARRAGADPFRAAFLVAERRLGAREWAVDGHSIADIHLFRLFWRFRNAFKPEPAEYPHLEAHYERMMARPAVQRTIAVEAAIGYELSW
jgi:glutathione S-transferase